LLVDLARLFRTETGQVAIFHASGTGGWEIALTNTLTPGARLFLPCSGQFAALWADSARRLGFEVETLADLAWGDAPPVSRIAEHLAADGEGRIAAVLIVHNETSTGVTADLAAIRQAIDSTGHRALLMVDGVSSIGSIEFRHDEWGVDVALTGSQKGLMLPAGLALLAFSARAIAATKTATSLRAYFDLAGMLAANADGYFPYTPSIPMLYGLRESLDILFAEGLDAVHARHRRLADGVRAAVQGWGLTCCATDPATASDTVTTILTPPSVDARRVIAAAFTRYNLALGAGLGPLAGKAFRIGHLGDLNEGMVLGALGLVEMVLIEAGVPVAPGSGVAAAQRAWLEMGA
jgi:alanine-glyoxylate transaminase/serine-glyoxylate transaminase/serine-pyruvate transaminase